MIKRSAAVSGILVFMIALLAATVTMSCTEKTISTREPLSVNDLQLSIHPGGARILTCRLLNKSNDPVSVVQVQITLFDADNRPVSGMSVVLHDIPAGDEISFREPIDSDEDVRGARVKKILVL